MVPGFVIYVIGLTAFGISQDQGLLRIYLAILIEQDDLDQFECRADDSDNETVSLTLCEWISLYNYMFLSHLPFYVLFLYVHSSV